MFFFTRILDRTTCHATPGRPPTRALLTATFSKCLGSKQLTRLRVEPSQRRGTGHAPEAYPSRFSSSTYLQAMKKQK